MNISLPQYQPRTISNRPAECQVAPLTWGREPHWDPFVRNHPSGTLFHTLAWRSAVAESFGHEHFYLLAHRDGAVVGVLPAFLISTPFVGRSLVSVPYAVGGGILANDQEIAHKLFKSAFRLASDLRCAAIDFRSEHAAIEGVPVLGNHVGFKRNLPANAEEVLEWIPRKARAVVRNARDKFGLSCDFDPDLLEAAWKLYCLNMRRLGSINYPYSFFESLLTNFDGRCWVCVVRRCGKPIAGLVTFLYRDVVMPYFFGCRQSARTCGAANFIYYCVMERAVREGYRIFDFGRSRKDNLGSCDFKRFHGFEPRPLEYQRCMIEAKKPLELTPGNPLFNLARKIWSKSPLTLTRPAGALLSRYIPG